MAIAKKYFKGNPNGTYKDTNILYKKSKCYILKMTTKKGVFEIVKTFDYPYESIKAFKRYQENSNNYKIHFSFNDK